MSIGLSASPFSNAIPPTVSVTATHDPDGTVHLYPIPYGATISPADAVRLGEYLLASQPQLPSDDTGDATETLAPVDVPSAPEPVADPTPVDTTPVADPTPVDNTPVSVPSAPVAPEPVADPTPVDAAPVEEPTPTEAPVDTPVADTTDQDAAPVSDSTTSPDPDQGIPVADPAPVAVEDQPEIVEVADQTPVAPAPAGWPSAPTA